jgi:hypothetical protein
MNQNTKDIIIGLESIIDEYIRQETTYMEKSPQLFLSSESYIDFINKIEIWLDQYPNNIGLQYDAPLSIKDLCLLIRDINLQLERANTKYMQGFITMDSLKSFKQSILFSFVSGVTAYVQEIKKQISQEYDEAFVDSYRETKKPWDAAKKQLIKISGQITEINNGYAEIRNISPVISEIQDSIYMAIESNDNSFNEVSTCLNELTAFIQTKDKQKITEEFEDRNARIQNIPMSKSNLDISIEQLIGQLPKMLRIPVSSHRGRLAIKEVSIQKLLKDWIWIEILPEIYEMWELNEVCVTSIKSTATNLKNRLSLIEESDEDDFNLNTIAVSVNSIQSRTVELCNKKDKLRNTTINKLKNELHLEKLYSREEEFISATRWSSNLDTSGIERSPIVESMYSLYKKGVKLFNEVRNESLIVPDDNSYELLSDYILKLRFDDHTDYNSIFLTKSYSGKSFYVEREQESKMIYKSLSAWDMGLKGSVLICGNRFSGKSSFGEKVLAEQKHRQTLVIRPNSKIRYNGRKHFTTNELNETLKFLKKYNDNKKTIIFIDDIGGWFTEKISVVSNLNALLEFTDNNYSKFFVLCGIDNSLLYHLGKRLDIKSSFVKTIDLSKANHPEFHKIIEMRHGATHMVIKDKDGNPVTGEIFAKYTKQIYKLAKKNIGDALRLWAHSLVENSDGSMTFLKFNLQELPDFLNDNNSIVIKTILLTKSISEYQLRGILGPVFKTRYRSVLSRLMGIGLIQRNLYQKLEINEDLVNQIADKLNTEGYL